MTPEEIAEIRGSATRWSWNTVIALADEVERLIAVNYENADRYMESQRKFADELDARNGEIICLKARIAALEVGIRAAHAEASGRLGNALSEFNRVYGDQS